MSYQQAFWSGKTFANSKTRMSKINVGFQYREQ